MPDVFIPFNAASVTCFVFRTDDVFAIAEVREYKPYDHLSYCRGLWAELHSKQDPTPEWFEDWLSRVPDFGCSCQKSFREYVKENPPRYDDFYNWSVEAHNWVNVKLGKPIWTGG